MREQLRRLQQSRIGGLPETHRQIEKIAAEFRQATLASKPTTRKQAVEIERQLTEAAIKRLLALAEGQSNRTKRQFLFDCAAYFARVTGLDGPASKKQPNRLPNGKRPDAVAFFG